MSIVLFYDRIFLGDLMNRYLSFNDFFKEYFSGKTVKLSLDGGFTCPNRDGLISKKGCLFCSDVGSGDFTTYDKNISNQILMQKELLEKKWKAKNYIAYFQNFTNTYASFEYLERLYIDIINRTDISGISIATRCDCLDDNIIELLKKLSEKKLIFLELGLQSTNEKTIEIINRGYSHKKFDEIVQKLQKNNIKFLFHIIYGLPFESEIDFKNTFDYANNLTPFGIKFHNLYITTNSPLYKFYLDNKFEILSKERYIDLIINSIINLNDKTVIHRITGDPPKKFLYEPKWCADKLSVISTIDKKLKELNVEVLSTDRIKKAVDFWKLDHLV